MSTHYRFTIRQLKEITDQQFLITLLNERLNSCTNPYAPLSQRIKATISHLEHGELSGYKPSKRKY